MDINTTIFLKKNIVALCRTHSQQISSFQWSQWPNAVLIQHSHGLGHASAQLPVDAVETSQGRQEDLAASLRWRWALRSIAWANRLGWKSGLSKLTGAMWSPPVLWRNVVSNIFQRNSGAPRHVQEQKQFETSSKTSQHTVMLLSSGQNIQKKKPSNAGHHSTELLAAAQPLSWCTDPRSTGHLRFSQGTPSWAIGPGPNRLSKVHLLEPWTRMNSLNKDVHRSPQSNRILAIYKHQRLILPTQWHICMSDVEA